MDKKVIPRHPGGSLIAYNGSIERRYCQFPQPEVYLFIMNKKAFTLAELLMVMVIMFVLAIILFPTLGRVREQGRRVQCTNNLRQHGIAWNLYLAEHNDRFPRRVHLVFYEFYSYSTFGGKQGTLDDAYAAEHRVLNRYLDIRDNSSPNVEVFHCPDDKEEVDVGAIHTNDSFFEEWGNSYLLNDRIIKYGGPRSDARERPFSTITQPHNRVYLETDYDFNNPGHGGKGRDLWGRNEVLVMVLFVDGHVAGPYSYDDDFENGVYRDRPVIWDPNGTYNAPGAEYD